MRFRSLHQTFRLALAAICLGTLSAVACGQSALERPVPAEAQQFEFIDEVVQRHIDEKKLVGAVTWIAQHGKVIHHAAHGRRDRDSASPMQRDTIFRIHSFTKAIATASAMMLWQEGMFQLDDPVANYLPKFASQQVYAAGGNQNVKRSLTVRDLILHTSGIVYPNENGSDVEKLYHTAKLFDIDTSLETFADRVAGLPLEFSPGEQWKYGMSIDLLGRLIEVWSGKRFEDFVRRRILTPLAMNDTDFFVPPAKRSRLATIYQLDDKEVLQPHDGAEKGEPDYVPTSSPVRCSPGGGLFSTASDYGTFLQMILVGGWWKGQQVLKPETIALMISDQLPNKIECIGFGDEKRDGFKFGLGFNVVTAPSRWDSQARIGEYGWGGAASCHYWTWPPQGVIVITLEATKPYNRNLEMALKDKIYKALD